MPQPRPSPGRKDHGPTVGQSHRAQSSDRGWIRSAPGDRWRHARARNRQAYRWPRQGRVDPRGKTSSTTCTGLSGGPGYPPVSMRTGCRSPGIIASRAPLSSRRWAPPFFNNGLDPDTTEGALDLVYALPNMRVEYLRVEPPGIPTAFWRSVGPSHNVFVTESFMDEMAAAAKQDPVAYRRALLDKTPRAKAVLELVAHKAGWGKPLPEGV